MSKATKTPKGTQAKPTRPKADWEAIERDYRTGKWTDQELADKHGNVVTRQAISKRAKEGEWTKDLSTAVRQATRAKVIAAEVKQRVDAEVAQSVATGVAESCQAATNAVLVAADIGAAVILRHRTDALQARDLVLDMLRELRAATTSPQQLAELVALAGQAAESPEQLASLQRRLDDLLGLKGRVNNLHRLADAMAKLQAMERKAFALDDDDKGSTGDDFWEALDKDEAPE